VLAAGLTLTTGSAARVSPGAPKSVTITTAKDSKRKVLVFIIEHST
jgi:hypothetical protein